VFVETAGSPGSDMGGGSAPSPPEAAPRDSFAVDSAYGRLRSVPLADPSRLALVPCNSVSRESARRGRAPCGQRAMSQHSALVAALRDEGIEVRLLAADNGLPDFAFTRDSSLMTPWGLVGLRPGAAHRSRESEVVLAAAAEAGVPCLGQIGQGRIEGGDVVLLRPGVLLIGISGERTDEAGAEALAAIFRSGGWEVIFYHFDPHFLHLDTLLCLADRDLAVACTDVLEDALLARLEAMGVELVPVAYKEARRLGCNLLSLGERRVVTAGTCPRVDAELVARNVAVTAVDLGDFVLCGGGAHCLTMPLSRDPG
jgi:N-dimethylarginine dimethylaminohydrolase